MGGAHSRQRMVTAESELLAHGRGWWLGSARRPADAPVTSLTVKDVQIGGDQVIHCAIAEQLDGGGAPQRSNPPLVLIHGYGCGLGYWYPALTPLAEKWPGAVYAVDNLGSGLSTRSQRDSTIVDPEAVEEFLVDGLERWRQAEGLDRMILCGHSLGSYVATCYAERHPEHVQQLVLTATAGLPQRHSQEPNAAPNLRIRIARAFWENGTSPFAMLRSLPEVAGLSALDALYVSKRFTARDWSPPAVPGQCRPDSQNLLLQYLYRNMAEAPPSVGGYAHSTLLMPGGWAKRPLTNRIADLKGSCGPNGPGLESISFIYGVSDWMDRKHTLPLLSDQYQRTLKGTGAASGGKPRLEVFTVAHAGHQLFLDNIHGAVDAVLAAVSRTARLSWHFDGLDSPSAARKLDVGDLVKVKTAAETTTCMVATDFEDGTYGLKCADVQPSKLQFACELRKSS